MCLASAGAGLLLSWIIATSLSGQASIICSAGTALTMHPEALNLFRQLADRSPSDREEYYAGHHVDPALRAEVESLLPFDTVCPHPRKRVTEESPLARSIESARR